VVSQSAVFLCSDVTPVSTRPGKPDAWSIWLNDKQGKPHVIAGEPKSTHNYSVGLIT